MLLNDLSLHRTLNRNPFDALRMPANRPAPQSNSRLWEIQKERQQRAVRDAGRIGYIGNDGSSGL